LFDICKILNVSLASMFPPEVPKYLPQPVIRPAFEDGIEHRTMFGLQTTASAAQGVLERAIT
jgi:hypothetical protein